MRLLVPANHAHPVSKNVNQLVARNVIGQLAEDRRAEFEQDRDWINVATATSRPSERGDEPVGRAYRRSSSGFGSAGSGGGNRQARGRELPVYAPSWFLAFSSEASEKPWTVAARRISAAGCHSPSASTSARKLFAVA